MSELDSRFRGNDDFGANVKKRWTRYASPLLRQGGENRGYRKEFE
jgi:hypothetical protein